MSAEQHGGYFSDQWLNIMRKTYTKALTNSRIAKRLSCFPTTHVHFLHVFPNKKIESFDNFVWGSTFQGSITYIFSQEYIRSSSFIPMKIEQA